VDEAISAGSSVRATIASLEEAHATVVGIGTFVLLGTVGDEFFATRRTPVVSLAREPLALWPPDECPLCRDGVQISS
jgi:orotate phosphoribosyltransferase